MRVSAPMAPWYHALVATGVVSDAGPGAKSISHLDTRVKLGMGLS